MTQPGFVVSGDAPQNYERYNAVIMAPFVEAVLNRADVQPGQAVLDLACGTGFVTRRASTVAGAGGRVAGLDLNPGMLAMARSIPATPGGASVDWHEGSALDLPFRDGEFDVVLCQQGVQFFPDLDLASREMFRVLRPGGRAAVTFWAALDGQPYMRAQDEALERALGQSMRGAFGLESERVERAFAEAGFTAVEVERLEPTVTLPAMEQFAPGQVGTLPLAAAFAALSEEQRAAYVLDVERAIESFRTARGEYECPFASWLVTGQR